MPTVKLANVTIDVLLIIATHDDESEQWGDLRGPITAQGISNRLAVAAGKTTRRATVGREVPIGLILYRLEQQGLVERADRNLLRSKAWPGGSPLAWCQPWRLTAKGRVTMNWPGVGTH
jgi:hypothetical protein